MTLSRPRSPSRLVTAVLGLALMASALVASPAAAATSSPQRPGTLVQIAPVRVLDARAGVQRRHPLRAGAAVTFSVLGRGAVPTHGVAGVLLRLETNRVTAPGMLTAYRADRPKPQVWSFSVTPGATTSGLTMVGLGRAGRVTLANDTVASVGVTVQVVGWIVAGSPPQPGSFVLTTPRRLVDTRSGLGVRAGLIGPSQEAFAVAGPDVPTGVAAAIVSVTAVDPAGSGYLTVRRPGDFTPEDSGVRFGPGINSTTMVVSAVSADGQLSLSSRAPGQTHAVVDLFGYVVAGVPVALGAFRAQEHDFLNDSHTPEVMAHSTVALELDQVVGNRSADTAALVVMTVDSTEPGRSRFTVDGARVAPDVVHVPGRPTSTTIMLKLPRVDRYVHLTNDSDASALYNFIGLGTLRGPDPTGTNLTFEAPTTADFPQGAPSDVSCPTPNFCAAVDSAGNYQIYDGSSWSKPARLPSRSPLGDSSYIRNSTSFVSCPAAGSCVALQTGQSGAVLTKGTWRAFEEGPAPQGRALSKGAHADLVSPFPPYFGSSRTLACASVSFCLAGYEGASALVYDGNTWLGNTSPYLNVGVEDAACPKVGFCLVLTTAGHALTFDGTSWGPAYAAFSGQGAAVGCLSETHCLVASRAGAIRSWTPDGWGPPIPTGLPDPLTDLACAGEECVATDQTGHAVRITPTAVDAPVAVTTGDALAAVSCGDEGRCQALSVSGLAASFAAGHWQPTGKINGPNAITDVACPSRQLCVAVDEAGRALAFDGSSWSTPAEVEGAGSLRSVSCVASTCVAVDNRGRAFWRRGGGWSVGESIDPGRSLVAVSCAAAAFCAAADARGSVLTFTATGWSAPHALDPAGLTVLSCPTTSSCLAAGVGGTLYRYASGRWSPAGSSPVAAPVVSLSCARPTECVIAGGGRVSILAGTRWGAPKALDADHPTLDVSCSAPGSCVAISQVGVHQLRAGAWRGGGSIRAEELLSPLSEVACADPGFCLVATSDGRTSIGRR